MIFSWLYRFKHFTLFGFKVVLLLGVRYTFIAENMCSVMIVKPHAFIPYRAISAHAMRYIGGVGYLTHISKSFSSPKLFCCRQDKLHYNENLLFGCLYARLHLNVQTQTNSHNNYTRLDK